MIANVIRRASARVFWGLIGLRRPRARKLATRIVQARIRLGI